MKKLFNKEEQEYIKTIIQNNINSEEKMLQFYKDKDNDLVEKEVERAINELPAEEAKFINYQAIKAMINFQIELYKKFKKEILDCINLSKELSQIVDKDINTCDSNVKEKMIKLFKNEIYYNEFLVEKVIEQKEDELYEGVIVNYSEEYPEVDTNDTEFQESIRKEIRNFMNEDKEYKKILDTVREEVETRKYILSKLEKQP